MPQFYNTNQAPFGYGYSSTLGPVAPSGGGGPTKEKKKTCPDGSQPDENGNCPQLLQDASTAVPTEVRGTESGAYDGLIDGGH